jgi:hypothetical protein
MWIFHFVENVIYGLSNLRYCFDIIVDWNSTVVLKMVCSLIFLFAYSHTEQKLEKKTKCSTEEHQLLTYIKYKPKIIINDIHIILTDMIIDYWPIQNTDRPDYWHTQNTDKHDYWHTQNTDRHDYWHKRLLTDTITDMHKILTDTITDLRGLLTC